MKLRFVSLFLLCASVVVVAQSNPVPLINQPLVPTAIKPGGKGFTLTVDGTGFSLTAVVNWNGTPRITESVSSTRLKAKIKASDIAKAGTAEITVTNPAPSGGTSNALFLPIRKPAPAVGMAVDANFSASGSSTVVGDFNNDGIPDIAVGHPHSDGTGDIEIYLGEGDGTFRPPIKNLSSIVPTAMTVGDFNGDGHIDLVVSDGKLFVSSFLGDGKGHLAQQQPFNVSSINDIAAADFNADGKLDLYLSNLNEVYGSVIDVYLGNGDGTFTAASNSFDPHYSGTPAIGDFNGDGKLDLAVLNQSSTNEVGVFLGNGDGTFPQSPLVYTTNGSRGISLNTADVNGDGNLDLITDSTCVLLGAGDGTFKQSGCGTGGPSYRVNIGDFNGDGKLDFAIAPLYNSQVVMLSLGNGDGTFQNPVDFVATGIGTSYLGFDVGDFKRDGKLGLVISGQNTLVFFQDLAVISPLSLAFGNQDVGTTSQPQIATLTNTGSSSLPIQIGINGTDPQDFAETDNCGSSLPAGQSCQINVTFTPQASGNRAASLYVKYPGFGSPQTAAPSGTGLTVSASLTPSALTFPLQLVNTTSTPQTATLTNTGQDAVVISNISATGPFAETNNCPSSLPVNGNCQIQVEFKPIAGGPANGTLSVSDNVPGSPQTVALSGTGTVVWLSVTGINFGDQKVGTKSPQAPIKLTNKGKVNLSISQIAITGTDPEDFSQTNNCGSSLPGGHSCTIKVRFTPQAKGQRSANLTLTDDDSSSPQTVPLAGTGT